MSKLVSVIVPVYDTEEFLPRCVDSILKQTYKNIEIILVDDGSPGRSPEICENYKNRFENIKVIHKENGGLSSARNSGIEYATGDYLVFIDSDDIINPKYIEVLYSLCEEYSSDISVCDFLCIDEKSILLKEQKKTTVEILSPGEAISRCCKHPEGIKYNVAWNKMYKRKLFDSIRYPVGKIHEDEFVTYRLLWSANKIVVSNLYLYYYVQRKGSITGSPFSIKRLDRFEAYDMRLDFLIENSLYNDYKNLLCLYFGILGSTYQHLLEDENQWKNELIKIRKKADELRTKIFDLNNMDLLSKVRVVYNQLPLEKKNEYKKIFGNRMFSVSDEYIFPFGRIDRNSKIAIYGAGNIGKMFYRQIITTDYAKIVAWVDAIWMSMAKSGLDVQPIDTLLKVEFDYVIIANGNSKIAEEIRGNLQNWGIEDNKIIWNNPKALSIGEAKEKQNCLKRLNKSEGNTKRRIFLMNTPDHGNVGDHALTIAAYEFIHLYFSEYEMTEISGKQWDYCNEEISKIIYPEDIIFFVGGGYMGDVWPKENNRVLDMINKLPKNKKVFLPQTFSYCCADYEQDKKIYSIFDNILFIHREHNSFKELVYKLQLCEQNNLVYPDMALFLKKCKKEVNRKGVKFCIRGDKESVVKEDVIKEIKEYCRANGMQFSVMDTVLDKNITRDDRVEELERMLNEISCSKLLITDRLHGMLFAAITHTSCIAFNNSTGKVEGVYKWISVRPNILLIDRNEVDFTKIRELYEFDEANVSELSFEESFEEMAREIRKWIKL